MTPAEQSAEADRLRAVVERAEDPVSPHAGRWLVRELQLQVSAMLAQPSIEGGYRVDPELAHRYFFDAEFHAWVLFEAQVRAEIALAAALGTVVADGDVKSFLQHRDAILDTEAKRARHATDEVYQRAVFAIAISRLANDPARRREQQAALQEALTPAPGLVDEVERRTRQALGLDDDLVALEELQPPAAGPQQ